MLNPYKEALYLMTKSDDFYQAKTNSLAFTGDMFLYVFFILLEVQVDYCNLFY